MRQLIDMDAIWKRALKVAERSLREHGAKLAPGLPRQCPFSLGEIISEDFDFDAALAKLRPAD